MKRIVSIILLSVFLLTLTACGSERMPVKFYFQRQYITYGDADSVIVAEERPSLSRDNSLSYLLTLYLEGPIDTGLALPVPPETRLLNVTTDGDHLTLVMNSAFFQLEGLDLTLVCACIASTCFDLTDAEQITFVNFTSQNETPISFSLTRSSLTLVDTVSEISEETAENR